VSLVWHGKQQKRRKAGKRLIVERAREPIKTITRVRRGETEQPSKKSKRKPSMTEKKRPTRKQNRVGGMRKTRGQKCQGTTVVQGGEDQNGRKVAGHGPGAGPEFRKREKKHLDTQHPPVGDKNCGSKQLECAAYTIQKKHAQKARILGGGEQTRVEGN